MFYAREFLAAADRLEPSFVAVQRRHLADEVGHVRWDEQLLDWIWPALGPRRRRLNARIFAWLMREYFVTPKRSGLRVVRTLVAEYPELRPRWPELRGEMLGLDSNPEFHRSAYSRDATPRSFARFDRTPEFWPMAGALAGYRPSPASAESAPPVAQVGDSK